MTIHCSGLLGVDRRYMYVSREDASAVGYTLWPCVRPYDRLYVTSRCSLKTDDTITQNSLALQGNCSQFLKL